MVLAVICLVGSLPIAVIFFRSHPSDKGLQPYGAELTEDEIKAIESKGKKKVVQADPEVTVEGHEEKRCVLAARVGLHAGWRN